MCSSRRHNPYLPPRLLEVYLVLGAITATIVTTASTTIVAATSTTPLALVVQSIALPRVHQIRDRECSPFIANNPCKATFRNTPAPKPRKIVTKARPAPSQDWAPPKAAMRNAKQSKPLFQFVQLLFRGVLPLSRVVLPFFRVVLPFFRVVLPLFRMVLRLFQVVLPLFRVVLPLFLSSTTLV